MRARLIMLVGLVQVALMLGLTALPAHAATATGQRVTFSGCAFSGTPALGKGKAVQRVPSKCSPRVASTVDDGG